MDGWFYLGCVEVENVVMETLCVTFERAEVFWSASGKRSIQGG